MLKLAIRMCLLVFLFVPTVSSAEPADTVFVERIDQNGVFYVKVESEVYPARLYGVIPSNHGIAYLRKKFSKKEVQARQVDKNTLNHDLMILYYDGKDISDVLLTDGLAWYNERFCFIPECEEYKRLEEQARAIPIGIWKTNEQRPRGFNKSEFSPWNQKYFDEREKAEQEKNKQ